MSRNKKSCSDPLIINSIKVFHIDNNDDEDSINSEALDYYEKYQILLLRPSSNSNADKSALTILQGAYKKYRSIIDETFTIENKTNDDSNNTRKTRSNSSSSSSSSSIRSEDIFDSKHCKKDHLKSWYCSFIVQKDDNFINDFLTKVPYKIPPVFNDSKENNQWSNKFQHTKPIWVFIGSHTSNTNDSNLQGRTEHTDHVSHAGTWHYQLTGKKIWFVRPLDDDEWLQCPQLVPYNINDDDDGDNNNNRKRVKNSNIGGTVQQCDDSLLRLKIECNQGDILFINTRLWWHLTEIPNTSSSTDNTSCSYARDFIKIGDVLDTNDNYTNVEGLYSTRKIRKGSIVLTESELPDCELPRSDSPNCAVDFAEDGTGILVAIKDINAGDFYTVENSDSEDDDENSDDDNDEDDD